MKISLSLSIDSAAAKAQLRQWGGEFREKVKVATAKAITAQAVEINTEVRAHVMAHMRVLRCNWPILPAFLCHRKLGPTTTSKLSVLLRHLPPLG